MRKREHSWLGNALAMMTVIAFLGFGMTARVAGATCAGDCNGNNTVTVEEVVAVVNIALGNALVSTCSPADLNTDNQVTIDEVLKAVDKAVNGGCEIPAVCGNGVKDAGEDCDLGGTCIGGANAGTHCTSEAQCSGNGVCRTGSKAEVACATDTDCAADGSIKCTHCVPTGGDGCAANCTTETQIVMNLVPGHVTGTELDPGTSGAVVWNQQLGPLALPFGQGATQTLAIGRDTGDGRVPLVVLAKSVYIPKIDVGGLACACVRGVAQKTCGGTLFNPDESIATDCTPGFTAGTCSGSAPQSCSADSDCTEVTLPDTSKLKSCVGGLCADCRLDTDCSGGQTCVVHSCDGKSPCAFVHGPGAADSGGNSGSGTISCTPGLEGVNLRFTEDSTGNAMGSAGHNDPDNCDPILGGSKFVPPSPTFPTCGMAPVIKLSGTSTTAGAAVVLNTTAIGQLVGKCSAQRVDFCSAADPYTDRGVPETLPSVTGTASGMITNANQLPDNTICNCPPGYNNCDISQCCGAAADADGFCTPATTVDTAQPITISGDPLPSCSQLSAGNVSGLGLAGAFTALSQNTINDIVVTNLLKAQ